MASSASSVDDVVALIVVVVIGLVASSASSVDNVVDLIVVVVIVVGLVASSASSVDNVVALIVAVVVATEDETCPYPRASHLLFFFFLAMTMIIYLLLNIEDLNALHSPIYYLLLWRERVHMYNCAEKKKRKKEQNKRATRFLEIAYIDRFSHFL